MVTALLIVIYIAFIGLGLPHSLFGAAWPAIQADFSVSIDSANYITILISGFTVIASMLGARLVNKFGTRTVVTFSTIFAALALLGFSLSTNLWMMCIFAIPLGFSSGAIDASLNNYIALHYSAMHMNFMHCFYGIGIMTSPYVMSMMLKNNTWQTGYRVIFLLQLVIAAIIISTFPLWKKVTHKHTVSNNQDAPAENLSYIKMAKNPSIRLDWLMCIAINAVEGVAGVWGSSYLIYAHKFTEAEAAGSITMFYIGMALGRFVSGLLSAKMESWKIIKIATAIMIAGTLMMFIPVPLIAVFGLFFVGFGNGPVYPNIMHLTPRNFNEKHSGSILGSQMAAAYFGILIGPPIFGYLANLISASVLPAYIAVWNVIFVVAAALFLRKIKQKKAI